MVAVVLWIIVFHQNKNFSKDNSKEVTQVKESAYQIIVDNHASKENTTRYAEHQGYKTTITEKDGEYTLTFQK